MKEKILLLLILLSVILWTHGNPDDLPKKKKNVVLDAGHGGHDLGAVGKNSKEKDIVLAITLKVGEYISQNMPDVEVIYTRKTDVFIPLHERTNIANNNNADLFVSIHANSNPNTRPYGTETFAIGNHKTNGNLEVAKKENSVIVFEEDYSVKYEGFDPNSAESYIMFSLMTNTYQKISLDVASLVQDEFRERAKRKDRGVKQAGFLVLWQASMPSILIETGFISNKEEEKYLISKQGQDYLASAIYRAVKTYLNQLDDNIDEAPLSQSNNISVDTTIKETPKTDVQNNLWLGVQITSSSKPLKMDHPVFKNYSDIFEYYENDMYKYTVGKYDNINKIKEFKQQVKNDFPGAFIVAFDNNVRIDLKTALKLLN